MTDEFMSLSNGAKALYFALNLSADDSGFVTNVRSVMSMLGVGQSELEQLDGKYLIRFEEEHCALIVHWMKHNTLKKLLFTKSEHPALEEKVYVDGTGLYTLDPGDGRTTLAEYKASAGGERYINRHNKTEENTTEENRTEQKKTESRPPSSLPDGLPGGRAGACGEDEDIFAEYEAAEPKVFLRENLDKDVGRKLHKMNTERGEPGNVFLSPKQVETLERMAPPEAVDRYIKRLGRMIEETGCDPKSHYRTIRKWIAEDIKP